MRERVLALTRYDSLGASSRVRILQYVPYLRERGFEVHPAPLLSNLYVRDLYAGRRVNVVSMIGDYARRLLTLMRRQEAAVVWIEKELLPWLPFPIERVFRPRARRIIVDYDDATWVSYAQHANPLVRRLLGGKIAEVMRTADLVAAGNCGTAEYACASGARNVIELPSVVDLNIYRTVKAEDAGETIRIGWIGSPATVHYLEAIGADLARLAARRQIRVICIGVDRVDIRGVVTECRPWSGESEAEEIRTFDIGIMPLTDGPWERGKCGYKLIQYMACGVPAVGSAVGANNEIIGDGVNGRLVPPDGNWAEVLGQLIDSPAQRATLAAAGRKRIEEKYSVQSRLDQLISILTV